MSTTQATGQPVRLAGLAADDYGRSDGRPPVILLHGMTFDRTTWRDIVPGLQRIDPRTPGRRDRPARPRPVTGPGDLRA
jgi:pimeloyl-ACP methyl ester carboxylesterase